MKGKNNMTRKAKFEYETFMSDNTTSVCFNKAKYSKEQALELGKKELLDIAYSSEDEHDFEIREGYIAHRCMYWEGENRACFVLYETDEKPRGGVPVWVVE